MLERFLLVGLIIAIGFPAVLRPRRLEPAASPLGGSDLPLWALLSITFTSFIALALLGLSRFFLPYLLIALGAIFALELFIYLPRGCWPGGGKELLFSLKSPRRWLWLAILALGIGLRVPPAFYLDGGQDQGVYVNLAAYYGRAGRPMARLIAPGPGRSLPLTVSPLRKPEALCC